jgi:hypothetical protein
MIVCADNHIEPVQHFHKQNPTPKTPLLRPSASLVYQGKVGAW